LSFTVESDTVGVHETVGQHTIVGREIAPDDGVAEWTCSPVACAERSDMADDAELKRTPRLQADHTPARRSVSALTDSTSLSSVKCPYGFSCWQ